MAVDLHVVRAQFGPQAQTGVTGAEVIQSDGETHGAVVVQGGVEQAEVFDRGLFGEFDHHLIRGDADVLQQLERAPGLVAGFEQRLRRDVEKQLAAQLLAAEVAAGALACQQLQFAQAADIARHAEQRQRRVQRAVGGAAGQGFVAEDAPLGEADDGLEQAMQVAVSEDGFQRAQLLGDGHGHLVLRNEKGPVSLPAPLFHDSSMTV